MVSKVLKKARRDFMFRYGRRLRQMEHWLIARAAMTMISLLRLLPPDRALNFADRVARRIGPLVGRHRVAVNNLRLAYPQKSDAEIEAIASDMWGNMARLAAEYIFLDALFDFDPNAAEPGRVEVRGVEHFARIAGEKKPHILFTGHLGNFELLPVAAATFGMNITALFRPPNNPYLADYIHSTRRSTMGGLLPSSTGASFALAAILENGGNIGVLVDQKFTNGVETTFFGRRCQSNPVLGMLARHYDCDVYPARCVRLPGNRFRLEIEDKLTLPRNKSGSVDVHAATQLLADVVERWVREDPGQWMWFHKRWEMSGRSRSRRGGETATQ
ncbi:lipid A biosynthesis lauroyl acyltransferase [Mesorhizobium sp. M3A.F.Ca.ET.080.04.2.1]|uniref:lipid A biosynthesis lauroyl acyltransferase n=1 Tax=Mesorhizobium sp. M3A.F.Ca.ET.080.04.2.1 TaxID=2493676 RepID=UPI000F7619B3|nr:lipid A biosynthesis lauroyl acyltransferase [Mesorhizobium sp. M3A.F.Ca.ET.080.04.2.1]AZO12434.1 lipid A biosynthesis lauroyl acyltransferase [Mesorhizobium sp. M3A.F.Ca.ET.080.04.2.1]TGT59427.1 lipid A biosynthesis lauroyl acyltransferase [Mesorhizobium sp. M00.F.Ca.ET.170.01.1.1]